MLQLLTTYLKKLKKLGLERNIPNISENNAEFIKGLIREKNPKHILEIGTANGYSTLQFALALDSPLENGEREETLNSSPDKGRLGGVCISKIVTHPNPPFSGREWSITTIEHAWNAHIEAVEHFRNCKVKNIHAIWGDAKTVIPTLADGFFDFVYIDAMKREYLEYLLLSLPKMTPNALIVLDDIEKFADKMQNLYDWLSENHIPFTLEKTDPDDAIMLIERARIV